MAKTKVLPPEEEAPSPFEQELTGLEADLKAVLGQMNERQREAVLHDSGPLLIIAGAGTGKTKVITHRIAYLVATQKARPSEILALTFTDKAAQEMEERVDVLLPYGYNDVWVSTFHSFGDRILREHAFELGLPDDFQVLSQAEQIVFLREHLFELPLKFYRTLADPTRYLGTLARFISRLKDEDITPEEYLSHVQTRPEPADPAEKEDLAKQKELAQVFQVIQELMAKAGKLDFGDQITLTLKLLREHPSALKELQNRFRYILVDEFQDTNFAQFELVKLLASGHNNITVVGDDDQSIFKFRGAAISNILNFEKTYAQAKRVVLTENYRSTQPILDAAYSLIVHNNPDRLEIKDKITKKLSSQRRKTGKVVEYFLYDTFSTEADSVASLIRERIASGTPLQEIAVLVRSNADADPFLKSLTMQGIPWRFTGNAGLYGREEIRLMLAFLRSLVSPLDSISLFHVASSEIYQMDMDELVRCQALVQKTNRPLLDIFKNLGSFSELEGLSKNFRTLAKTLVQDRERYLELSRATTPGRLLYQFLSDKDVLKKLVSAGTQEAEEKIQNLSRFFKIMEKLEGVARLDRLAPFVMHLDQLISAGDDPPATEADPDDPAVSVLTLHKAKGLEFSMVFLVALAQGKFPVRNRKEALEMPEALIKDILPSGDFHLQEERRLFYVGMTRAKDELILTSARDYGGRRQYKPSIFVQEALGEKAQQAQAQKTNAVDVIQRQAGKTPQIQQPHQKSDQLQLSAKAVEDYRSCPLKYKYSHILKVPRSWNQAIAYGLALHAACEDYYKRRLAGQQVSLETMWSAYEAAWQSEGFLNQEHERQRFEAGKEALRKFYEKAQGSSQLPTYVEKEFKFLVDDTIKMIGRWDRVDISDGQATIIDYKSSDVRQQKDADKRVQDSLQMAVYALAWKKIQGQYPAQVQLHFLDSGLVGSYAPDDAYAQGAEEEILKAAQGIRAGNFEADPVYMACNYCSYNPICPSAEIVKT